MNIKNLKCQFETLLQLAGLAESCLKVGHGLYNKGWQSALKALSKFNRPYETKNP